MTNVIDEQSRNLKTVLKKCVDSECLRSLAIHLGKTKYISKVQKKRVLECIKSGRNENAVEKLIKHITEKKEWETSFLKVLSVDQPKSSRPKISGKKSLDDGDKQPESKRVKTSDDFQYSSIEDKLSGQLSIESDLAVDDLVRNIIDEVLDQVEMGLPYLYTILESLLREENRNVAWVLTNWSALESMQSNIQPLIPWEIVTSHQYWLGILAYKLSKEHDGDIMSKIMTILKENVEAKLADLNPSMHGDNADQLNELQAEKAQMVKKDSKTTGQVNLQNKKNKKKSSSETEDEQVPSKRTRVKSTGVSKRDSSNNSQSNRKESKRSKKRRDSGMQGELEKTSKIELKPSVDIAKEDLEEDQIVQEIRAVFASDLVLPQESSLCIHTGLFNENWESYELEFDENLKSYCISLPIPKNQTSFEYKYRIVGHRDISWEVFGRYREIINRRVTVSEDPPIIFDVICMKNNFREWTKPCVDGMAKHLSHLVPNGKCDMQKLKKEISSWVRQIETGWHLTCPYDYHKVFEYNQKIKKMISDWMNSLKCASDIKGFETNLTVFISALVMAVELYKIRLVPNCELIKQFCVTVNVANLNMDEQKALYSTISREISEK